MFRPEINMRNYRWLLYVVITMTQEDNLALCQVLPTCELLDQTQASKQPRKQTRQIDKQTNKQTNKSTIVLHTMQYNLTN